MLKYLIHKNHYILLYLLVSPLRAISNVACAGALAVAINYASSGELSSAWQYALFFGIYILVDLLIDMADQAVRFKIAERTMTALRADAFHKLANMCYTHYFEHNSADYLAILNTDAEIIRKSYFFIILSMYSDFLRCATAIAILIYMSPVLGIFVLGTSLLQALIPIIFSNRLENAGKVHSDMQSQYMKTLKESLLAFPVAKVFHIESILESRHKAALLAAEKQQRKMSILKEWTSSLSFVFNQIAHLGVFLLGAILNIKGRVSIAEIIAASELIVYISYPILWLNGEFSELRLAKASAQKIKSILSETDDVGGNIDLPKAAHSIEVKDLSFQYGSRQVLSNVSFLFESGKKYLITGHSGGGKSTLFRLILGFQEDYQGNILIGNRNIKDLTRESLSNCMCLIPQEPYLFDDTLYNNICLYEQLDEQIVMDVIRRVGLGDLVSSLPNGVHTALGEGGMNLSGGEKQRVSLARAFVRNIPILLLDEITSNLDPATAREIEDLVLEMPQKTVLLISHNASSEAQKRVDAILNLCDSNLV